MTNIDQEHEELETIEGGYVQWQGCLPFPYPSPLPGRYLGILGTQIVCLDGGATVY
jgi:hypothetical protein